MRKIIFCLAVSVSMIFLIPVSIIGSLCYFIDDYSEKQFRKLDEWARKA